MMPQAVWLLLSISAVAAFKKCGIRNSNVHDHNDRIVGGSETEPGEYPWMISVQGLFQNEFSHFCGGSILDEYWILTAAHCVAGGSPDTLQIVAAEHDLRQDEGREQRRNIKEIINHPQWNDQTVENDIALLKLTIPLNLNSSFVSPICLPKAFEKFQDRCVATGWGLTKEGGQISETLQEIPLPIVSGDVCRKSLNQTFVLNNSYQVCAGYSSGGKDTCRMDSGGPLMCQDKNGKFVLVGIVSFGIGCARPDQYGVFTRVSSYIDWIIQEKSNA